MRPPLPAAALLAAALLSACATAPAEQTAASSRPAWRPAPVADAPDPNAAVSAAPAEAWRTIDPDNLLVMDLKEGGRVLIELARSEEHTSELQSQSNLVCRLLLEKKKT